MCFKPIEEEELVDITNEMDDLFEEQAPDLEIVLQEQQQEKETYNTTKEEGNDDVETHSDDDAISIEDLIRLDSLTPLERMERSKSKAKAKTTKDILKEDDTEEMKKKSFDFSAIDELIEQAKKEVSLEITNEDFLDITDHPKPSPSPKSSFGSWLKQIQSSESEESEEPEEKPLEAEEKKPEKEKGNKKNAKKKEAKNKKANERAKKKKKKKKKKKSKQAHPASDEMPTKPKLIAEQSLMENTEIVSETLAVLLVKQENYKKAIKMYDKLSLIFPEKSSFFAEQIKKLKNLIT